MISPDPSYGPTAPGDQAPASTEGAAPVVTGFATNLKLNKAQEARMMEYFFTRIDEVSEEMGRDSEGMVRLNTWMGLRVQNKATYDNDLEWRKALGGVFEDSNFTMGTNRGYARLLSARARADLLGTSPFFGCMSTRNADPVLAAQVEAFVQAELEKSNVTSVLREGLKTAIICNEAVLKTSYLLDQTMYLGPAMVAVQMAQNGQMVPILTPNKQDYVYPNDDFLPDPAVQGLMRLKKDPSFAVTARPQFQQFTSLSQKLTHYDNVHSQVLDCRDFLCPLKVTNTWEADINVHLFEKTPEWLRGTYRNIDMAEAYFGTWRESDTGILQPRRMQGEEYNKIGIRNTLLIGDGYIRFDADQDGMEEEIMIVADIRGKKPVFYDYLGNHMRRRPFSVITGVEREEKRWYGKGVFTMMYHSGLYIDTQINRINEKSSQNSSITWIHKNAFLETKTNEQVTFGTKKNYTANDAWPWGQKEPVGRKNLQADAELDLTVVEKMQQASAQEFGAISAPMSSGNKLNQSETATGIMSTERDATVLSQDTEREQIDGIQMVLWQSTEMILDQMDPVEIQFSKDGQSLATLNKDEIRYLERDVRLLMTKTRSTAMLETNSKAEAVWLRYMHLSPPMQKVGRDFYIKQLKGLEVDNAENYCPMPTEQDIQAYAQQQAAAAAGANQKPPNATVAAKLGDFEATTEQPQIKQKFYEINPAPPNAVEATKKQDAKLEVQTKGQIAQVTEKAKADHAPQPPKQPVSKR